MKKFRPLLILLGALFLFLPSSHAQEPVVLTKKQKKDAAKLVTKIRAKLPAGWKVEYPVIRGEFGDGFGPKKESEPLKTSTDFLTIKVIRLEKVNIKRLGFINMGPSDALKLREPLEVEFGLSLNIVPFVSKDDYKKIDANNKSIQKQVDEARQALKGVKMSHKNEYYLPTTPEEKAKVAVYHSLQRLSVTLPQYYFRSISLEYPSFVRDAQESRYSLAIDKTIRRECAVVTQDVYSLLTNYSGEKFKIDEEALEYEYPKPEPPIIEKKGDLPGS